MDNRSALVMKLVDGEVTAEPVTMRAESTKRKFEEAEHDENNCENILKETTTEVGTCPKCLKVFLDLHSLTRHVKEHNTNASICGICDKKLCSVSSLDRHMLIHTREKPFKCNYCPYAFTTNSNRNRHENTAHGLETTNRSSGRKINRQYTSGSPSNGSPNEFSTSGSPIPMFQWEGRYYNDDRLKAAESLLILSESFNLSDYQDFPLDLSVQAIDLTKKTRVEQCALQK